MILYGLYRSIIGKLPDKFFARPITPQVYETEDVIRRMLESGSTITRSDIIAVYHDMRKTIQNILQEGGRVNLNGFCQFFPVIKGVFEDEFDSFDSSRHSLDISSRVSAEFKLAFQDVKLEKTEVKPNLPNLKAFLDLKTGEKNSIISSNSIAALKGSNLKFDPFQVDEGLFLQNMQDKHYIPINLLSRNTESELNFFCPPEITEGVPYRLELRNRIRMSKDLKKTRSLYELIGAA
ncbi:MAG: DUF4469 domain-containing protein [Leptospiraceae bacterium]|nr:DUF4469 domain-containing protein [Leptospiraceae bacterium]MCP5502520.1 DUF4469 domain-containing protein [Leptospiraceae bacterium]